MDIPDYPLWYWIMVTFFLTVGCIGLYRCLTKKDEAENDRITIGNRNGRCVFCCCDHGGDSD